MNRLTAASFVLACAVVAGPAAAQDPSPAATAQGALPAVTVRLPQPVLASGKPVPAGTYQFRITNEHPVPLPGQAASAQRFVEIVRDGQVIAREVAEVLPLDEAHPIGTSLKPRAAESRVEPLKGGEFVRVSISDSNARYLIHLPVSAAGQP